jgi:hypothetical protein
MNVRKTMVCFSLAAVVSLDLLAGCGQAQRVAREMTDPRIKGPPHERLKWKAENFFTDSGVISLCKAIEAKDLAEIDRLVKSGVNVNAKGRGNMTPLLWAFPMGEEVFGKMLELGADPNVRLTERVWFVCLESGNSVVSACASPILIEGLVHKPYFYDAPMDNYLKLVLEHGGNPNIQDAEGKTPLFYFRSSVPSKLADRICLLLGAGADINHKDEGGQTPLVACIGRDSDYLLRLLEAGADYRIADDNGRDLILNLEWLKMPQGPRGQVRSALDRDVGLARPVFEWLTNEGVNWDAARAALNSPETMRNLKNLPADYRHRPWLPQRPTLKKPDQKAKE